MVSQWHTHSGILTVAYSQWHRKWVLLEVLWQLNLIHVHPILCFVFIFVFSHPFDRVDEAFITACLYLNDHMDEMGNLNDDMVINVCVFNY